MPPLPEQPGLLFVAAALLPLAAFALLLLAACAAALLRPYREADAVAPAYRLLGGDAPGRTPAYVALAAAAGSLLLALSGAALFALDQSELRDRETAAAAPAEEELALPQSRQQKAKQDDAVRGLRVYRLYFDRRWAGSVEWLRLYPSGVPDPDRAVALRVGFRVDGLTVPLFALVTLVALLAQAFALGYLRQELAPEVTDHEVVTDDGPLRRRGRYGSFFLYASLLAGAVLGLLLADNLLLAFAGWQLAGAAAYFLIAFYRERFGAAQAAAKTFLVGRVGDAGFLAALSLLWVYFGTLNFDEMFTLARAPRRDAHGERVELAGRLVRVAEVENGPDGRTVAIAPDDGPLVLLMPHNGHVHADDVAPLDEGGEGRGPTRNVVYGVKDLPRPQDFGAVPYWLLTAAGLGLVAAAAARAAQVPLHVWLPDAAEAPAPAGALVHAAAFAPAGVYLLARCYPLLTPAALLAAAYCGALTLLVCASVAAAKADVKRVLAYTAGGQLGLMTLGLGVGGWAAGLTHLVVHGCAMALLFLGAGSVIYACHNVQDLRRMGGLLGRLPVTGWSMLVGVLVLSGAPLLSGWYSKGAVQAAAFGFAAEHRGHALLFVLPLAASGLAAFALFRLWFLAFAGAPRDARVHQHAAESPLLAAPLVVLAVLAAAVAWPGWGEPGFPEGQLRSAEPASVAADFGAEAAAAGRYHALATGLTLGAAALGALFAALLYVYRVWDPEETRTEFPRVHALLMRRWYFNELYRRTVVRPVLAAAAGCRAVDLYVLDGAGMLLARGWQWLSRWAGRFDRKVVDGLADGVGAAVSRASAATGGLQTGSLRGYALWLVLAAAGVFVALMYVVTVVARG
jgi:NADH-quinone oxidoreductase subunit L